jgi:hypothetical protein
MTHATDSQLPAVDPHPDAAGQPQPTTVAVGTSSTLQVDPELPEIDAARSLIGWRREFCVELLGEGCARIFVRAVRMSSFKATELRRAVLFHRLDVRFADLAGCVATMQPELEHLADTARRTAPSKANLFVSVAYDRGAWERVEQSVERWARR